MTSIPPHERRILLATLVGWAASGRPGVQLTPEQQARYDAMAARREAGEPLQHITGEAHFRHETLAVGPGVFVPRPETEVMTGWVLDQLAELPAHPTVVELCAGSGAISLAIAHEHPGARQFAVELSDDALPWLERNLSGTDVQIVHGDMADALPELDGTVDVVVANPPYVPLDEYAGLPADVRDYDPPQALFSGDDGLDAMHVVAGVAKRLLRPGGYVAAEHAELQHDSVQQVFVDAGFVRVRDHQDLTERWRYVTAETSDRMDA